MNNIDIYNSHGSVRSSVRSTATLRRLTTALMSFLFLLVSGVVPAVAATPKAAMQPAGSKVFVRVDYVGGYLPYEYSVTMFPATLLVDTKLYRPGAMIMVFPGPAVSPVEERIVGSTSATSRARALYDALVTPKGGWGNPPIADAPSAAISVTVGNKSRTVIIPSFGFTTAGQGMTAAQATARRNVQRAIAGVDALNGTPRMYRPATLEAWVLDGELKSDPLEEPQAPLAWPATVPSVKGCNVMPARLLPATSNQQSTFSSGGQVFRAVFRPVMPGETPCKRTR